MICKEIPNGGKESVGEIPHPHEQQFFLLLKKKLPSKKITYEKSIFSVRYDDGKIRTTSPDFFLEMGGGKTNIIEITTRSKEVDLQREKEGYRSKSEKKRIMKLIAPEYKYTVLYKEHLLNIEKHNSGVNFFEAKKHKTNSK
jgi:hypothetical protein